MPIRTLLFRVRREVNIALTIASLLNSTLTLALCNFMQNVATQRDSQLKAILKTIPRKMVMIARYSQVTTALKLILPRN